MPETKSFVIGEREFPLQPFTLRQLQALIPLYSNGELDTPGGVASMMSAIFEAVRVSAPEMTFAAMQEIPGATMPQVLTAFQEIGVAIGYYRRNVRAAPGGEGDAA